MMGSERKLRAKAILIATGSRPLRPANISFDIPGVCDTDTILNRGRVPKEILIVGGGPVGVEFATICHALGTKVTLLDRGTRLMSMMDGELSDCMEELFKKWGITILFGSTVESVATKGDGLEVKLSSGERLFPDTVLFAAGRVANTEDLGLETAGVARDSRGTNRCGRELSHLCRGYLRCRRCPGPHTGIDRDGARTSGDLSCLRNSVRRNCRSVSGLRGLRHAGGLWSGPY